MRSNKLFVRGKLATMTNRYSNALLHFLPDQYGTCVYYAKQKFDTGIMTTQLLESILAIQRTLYEHTRYLHTCTKTDKENAVSKQITQGPLTL